jgi:hypothetical protein
MYTVGAKGLQVEVVVEPQVGNLPLAHEIAEGILLLV